MKYETMKCCILALCLAATLCADSNHTIQANCTKNASDPKCCPSPHIIVNNTCVECTVQHCSQCSDEEVCQKCDTLFKLTNNNTECTPINATQCEQNKYYANGTCHARCAMSVCWGCQKMQENNDTEYFSCNKCHSAQNVSCQCVSPNIAVNQTTCLACEVANCRVCSSDQPWKCQECLSGHKIQQNSTKCSAIEQCQSGQYLYNGSCYKCGISNCQQCGRQASNLSSIQYLANSSDNGNVSEQYCIRCIDGYNVAANSSAICQFMCDPNQSYYNGSCVQCGVNDCRKCSKFDPQVCEECEYGDSNSSSISCPSKPSNNTVACQGAIMYCKTCVKQANSSSKQCSVCEKPYVLTLGADHKTTSCVAPSCPSYLMFMDGSCQCKHGYFLNTTSNACSPCIANCANCSSWGSCVQCFEGYYNNNSSCAACGANCASCSGLQSCQICRQGFRLVSSGTLSACVALPQQLTGLTSATLNGSAQSVACQYGCSACSVANSVLTCSSCIAGRYLQTANAGGSSICMACPSGCRTCVNSTYCTQCYDRYIVNETNLCAPCKQSNCLVCQGSTSYCSICQPGFRLTPENNCSKCPDRCLQCSASQCTSCENGLIPLNGYCVECASGCSVCSPTNASMCTQCNNGFYLNSASTCVKCLQGCRRCDSTGCLQCDIQYMMNKQKKCVVGCGGLCGECGLTKDPKNSANSIYNCTKCIYGYILRNTVCVPKAYPLANGFCKLADYWNGSACVLCNVNDSKCVNCQMVAQKVVCTRCDVGYTLEVNGCVRCAEGCSNCYSRDNCINCQNGYYMQQLLGRSTDKCLPCSKANNCNSCIYSASQCTSCLDGYIFEGFKCISKINIGMTLHIDQTPSTMMLRLNDLKSQIIRSVKEKLRNQTQYVTVRSYKEGSTIVGMNVSVPDGITPVQAAYNIYYKVVGKDFPFKLTRSPTMNYNNYQAQSGEEPGPGWGNRVVGIIIGCIFGLLLLGVIFLFMRMRKQQMDRRAASPPPKNENEIELPPGTGQQLSEKQKSELFDIQ